MCLLEVYMNGKTHQLVGLTGSVLTSAILYKVGIFDVPASLAAIAMSSIGSYIPDIDHVGSKAGKKVPILSYPIKGLSSLCSWLYKKTGCKIFNRIGEWFEHRGIFHAPLFWMLIFVPLFIFIPPLIVHEVVQHMIVGGLLGLALGVVLHLFADMLNPTGIPLLMPIIHKKFRLAKIVTGSKAELGFKVLMILLLFISIGLAILIFLNIV